MSERQPLQVGDVYLLKKPLELVRVVRLIMKPTAVLEFRKLEDDESGEDESEWSRSEVEFAEGEHPYAPDNAQLVQRKGKKNGNR